MLHLRLAVHDKVFNSPVKNAIPPELLLKFYGNTAKVIRMVNDYHDSGDLLAAMETYDQLFGQSLAYTPVPPTFEL